MSYRVVIPARYSSTRLPGKPLADICGKPMIVRVVEAALCACPLGVWVATDDPRVADTVRAYGYESVLTRADHPSGTDRIAEVADFFDWADDEIVVNVQGDEPLIDPGLIRSVAAALANDAGAAMATAAHRLEEVGDFFNPNVVKVVCDASGRALYFSRAPIPWDRDGFANTRSMLADTLGARRHIGLYAYRVDFLRRYGQLEEAPLERSESLEQLRALWHGFPIQVVEADRVPAAGVDTAEDLERVRQIFDVGSKSA